MSSVARASSAASVPVLLLLLVGTSEAVVKLQSSKDLSPPALACSTDEVRLVVKGDMVARSVFTVKNEGGRMLEWSIQTCPSWVTIKPRKGSLRQQESQEITIEVDGKSLRQGLVTEGVIAIAAGGRDAPFEIRVGVDVIGAPKVTLSQVGIPEPVPGLEEDRPSALAFPTGGGFALDGIEIMVGFGTRSDFFVGAGGTVRQVEFGLIWGMVGDEEDWGEAYCGLRRDWGEWYMGGGLTLDFAVSESDASSDTFGAWYLHGGWQKKTDKGLWGLDLRMSPAVAEFSKPFAMAVTYGW